MNKLFDVCNDFSLSENTKEEFESGINIDKKIAGYSFQQVNIRNEDIILFYEDNTKELHYAYGSQGLEDMRNIEDILEYLQDEYY